MSTPFVDQDGHELTGPIPDACPLCGGEVEGGFGLMGGGYGPYYLCIGDEGGAGGDVDCPWFAKKRYPPGEEE